ncbi:uncharacterized protein DS421_11g334390 [Arachis hypogaea]|nr:uncharacterized protein DS421_11g334390 [Arachis hypogaea]
MQWYYVIATAGEGGGGLRCESGGWSVGCRSVEREARVATTGGRARRRREHAEGGRRRSKTDAETKREC